MANAVVGETTSPNYFKEILQFLYPHFGNLEYYSLEAISSKVREDKQNEFNTLIHELKKQAIFIKEKAIFKDNKFSHNAYQLTIEGFTYCRIHKDYFSLE